MDSSTCSICELHSLVLPPVVPIGDEHETVPINNQVLNKYMCPPGYHQNPSVITILDLWQLLHMGTGRTVTHQDFPIKKTLESSNREQRAMRCSHQWKLKSLPIVGSAANAFGLISKGTIS